MRSMRSASGVDGYLKDINYKFEEFSNMANPNAKPVTEEKKGKKFLGMPKTTGIIVTSVVGLGILIGGYFIYKKLKK